ncbi:hypothetical protein A6M27_09805 [Acidithiobacillus thiooxidans]|uniref:Uncharacterized protein n=1 Tax=Acidithiobacillus thiooxidans TaxID=930 RepID=A0A1C2JI52_ACITH|nr:hypothetical protein [Acidithiobacillus thiooxidans]OCX74443.1 hypothetical protein A6P07_05490 [Acidithiobacillus thiooxidans]OCX75615.1 hypothetical protein A6O24_09690 [Acidithiobacillus thiooxidans]OCX81695.1 hypothetical protein A6O26_12455 [Acidithiobacillus thiooxidans]OCX87929.1 hypothetical protein A6M27_09805 [Acidithiobacillus thiooxidans]
MANIEQLMIGQIVTANIDGQERKGEVVGRRINERIEGYLAPLGNGHPPLQLGQDMVQISFHDREISSGWVTTGLTCAPDHVELTS